MANSNDLGGGRSTAALPDTNDVKQKASEVKQKASEVLEDAKGQAKDLASEAKKQTVELAGQARDQVSQLISERKDQAAERLGGLAGALRDTAQKLQNDDADSFGRYADRAAEQVDKLSSYLRDNDLRGFVRDTETLARRHPDLFLGGTFLAGLFLARFLKSSAPEQPGGSRSYQQATAGFRGSDARPPQRSSWAPERRPGEALASGTGAPAYNATLGG
jgi:gas vesicle protein